MGGLSGTDVQVAVEISRIAATPDSLTVRAEALLEPLSRLVAFDAAQITLLDPERRCQSALVRCGFPDRVRRYMDGDAFVEDLERIGLHRARLPVRVKDMPSPEVPLWAEYIQPAGFREGLGVPLVTTDGRYLGQLAMITEAATPASDATCHLLAALAPLIAHAVDPMRTVSVLASMVKDAVAGVLLTRAGNTTPLPGMPDHRLLTPGGPVLEEVAALLSASDTHGRFLTAEAPCRLLKVVFLACRALPPGHLRAVVLLCPAGNLRALTHRELSILGMLIAGWSGRRVAACLGLSMHAVITALEDIRTKFDAPTRAAAVLRAADQGLHLPPSQTRGDR